MNWMKQVRHLDTEVVMTTKLTWRFHFIARRLLHIYNSEEFYVNQER